MTIPMTIPYCAHPGEEISVERSHPWARAEKNRPLGCTTVLSPLIHKGKNIKIVWRFENGIFLKIAYLPHGI